MNANEALEWVSGEWAGIGPDRGVPEVEALAVLRLVIDAATEATQQPTHALQTVHLVRVAFALDGLDIPVRSVDAQDVPCT